jgi:hypothetical protein
VGTDLSTSRTGSQPVAVPKPTCIKARRATAEPAGPDGLPAPPAAQISIAGSGSGRVTARETLLSALSGVRLGGRARQFLSKLVGWDKRNATSVASLLWRARQAGREEAALTPRQLEVVLAALHDAAIYRSAGVAAATCWDCDIVPGGRCAEHAKDNDRAHAYAEVAAALSGNSVLSGGSVLAGGGALANAGQEVLAQPLEISGYLHRAPVAS